jgi:hypothetical protein
LEGVLPDYYDPFVLSKTWVWSTEHSLVFGRFAHDSQGVLAAVYRLALMRVELGLQVCGRIFGGASLARGHFELLTAIGANCYEWGCADMLHDPNSPFWHDSVPAAPLLCCFAGFVGEGRIELVKEF